MSPTQLPDLVPGEVAPQSEHPCTFPISLIALCCAALGRAVGPAGIDSGTVGPSGIEGASIVVPSVVPLDQLLPSQRVGSHSLQLPQSN